MSKFLLEHSLQLMDLLCIGESEVERLNTVGTDTLGEAIFRMKVQDLEGNVWKSFEVIGIVAF